VHKLTGDKDEFGDSVSQKEACLGVDLGEHWVH